MSARLQKIEEAKTHVIHEKLFRRLSKEEFQMCVDFVVENDALDVNDFATKANRWLLDKPKPKRFSDMWAIVCLSNHGARK